MPKSNSSVENDRRMKIMDEWIEKVNDQLTDIKHKVQLLEYQKRWDGQYYYHDPATLTFIFHKDMEIHISFRSIA